MRCRHRGRLAADSWGAWPTWLSVVLGGVSSGNHPLLSYLLFKLLLQVLLLPPFVSSLPPSSVPSVLVLTWQHTERRVSEMADNN